MVWSNLCDILGSSLPDIIGCGPAIMVMLFYHLEFGSLTQAQLMEKVRALQNMAYQLGVEEGIP